MAKRLALAGSVFKECFKPYSVFCKLEPQKAAAASAVSSHGLTFEGKEFKSKGAASSTLDNKIFGSRD